MIDDDKRTVILARRERGQSIREIGATTGVSRGLCSAWYRRKRQGPLVTRDEEAHRIESTSS